MKSRLLDRHMIYNRRLLRCGFFASTVFMRLILVVDDGGHFFAEPDAVCAAAFPMIRDVTPQMVEEAMQVLEREGLLRYYTVRGERYLELTGWEEHQSIRYKKPEYPYPPQEPSEKSAEEAEPPVYNNIISIYKETETETETEIETETETETVTSIPPLTPPSAEDEPRASASGQAACEPSGRGMQRDALNSHFFDRFWERYPRKQGKHEARRAFDRLRVDAPLLDTMLAAIERSRRSDQWTRENGRFIPSPLQWIRGRRWEDEIPNASPRAAPDPKTEEAGSFDTDEFFAAAVERSRKRLAELRGAAQQ